MTYASLYEKYWNILDSIIMFNGYCKNGPIVNETMLEVLKLVTKENNPKTIEFFIKQSTHNPKEFNNPNEKEKMENKKSKPKNFYGFDDEYIELQRKLRKIDNLMDDNNKNKSYNKTTYKIKMNNKNDNIFNNKSEDIMNNMTLEGYKLITKGYFYNIKLNLNDISTKILCVHSNVDSFINIHNISALFDNDISSYHITPLKELFHFSYKNKKENVDNTNYRINKNTLTEIHLDNKNIESKNKDKINTVMGYNLGNFKTQDNHARKLIIYDGSHDVSYCNNKENIICTTLISYFN